MAEIIDIKTIQELELKKRDEEGAATGELILLNHSPAARANIIRAIIQSIYDYPEMRDLFRDAVRVGDKLINGGKK